MKKRALSTLLFCSLVGTALAYGQVAPLMDLPGDAAQKASQPTRAQSAPKPVRPQSTPAQRLSSKVLSKQKFSQRIHHRAFTPPLLQTGTLAMAPVGSFDGDRRADLFAVQLLGRRTVWQLASGGSAPLQTLRQEAASWDQLAFGDFDGDGRADVFYRRADGAWLVSSAGVRAFVKLHSAPFDRAALRFGDFDGDGRTDVAHLDKGSLRFASAARGKWQTLGPMAGAISDYLFGDFDCDGRTDVFRIAKGGQWQFSPGARGRWQNLARLGGRVSEFRAADFDGDGRDDIFSTTRAGWRYASAGLGKWRPLQKYRTPLRLLRFADVEGDGRVDVLSVVNTRDGYRWQYADDGRAPWQPILMVQASAPSDSGGDSGDDAGESSTNDATDASGNQTGGSFGGGAQGPFTEPLPPPSGVIFTTLGPPSQCLLTAQQINHCGAIAAGELADRINVRQGNMAVSCCTAIEEAQADFGDVHCRVVREEVQRQFNCIQ